MLIMSKKAIRKESIRSGANKEFTRVQHFINKHDLSMLYLRRTEQHLAIHHTEYGLLARYSNINGPHIKYQWLPVIKFTRPDPRRVTPSYSYPHSEGYVEVSLLKGGGWKECVMIALDPLDFIARGGVKREWPNNKQSLKPILPPREHDPLRVTALICILTGKGGDNNVATR